MTVTSAEQTFDAGADGDSVHDSTKRSGFRQTLNLIGGRYAASQRVGLTVLILLSVNISQAGYQETGSYAGLQIRVVVISLFAAWLFFAMAGSLLNAVVPKVGILRTSLVLALYMSTEMLRTSSVYLVSQELGLTSDAQWGIRLSAAASTALVFFGIVSALVNDTERYREIYKQTFERRRKLETLAAAAQETLAQTQLLLRQRIRSQLEEALSTVIDEFHRASPRYGLIADRLFMVVDDVVRPTSHELFTQPVAMPDAFESVTAPRIKFGQLMRSATLANPIRAGLYFGLFLLVFAPVVAAMHDFSYLLPMLVAFSSLYIFSAVAQRWLVLLFPRWRFIWRAVVLCVVFSLPAMIVMSAVRAAFNLDASLLLLMSYGVILGLVAGWVLAILSGLHAARRELLGELKTVNDELYWAVTRMQSQMWADQKALALTLHSDVQSTLLAAALKLRIALESKPQDSPRGDANSGTVLAQVQKLVADAAAMETKTTSQQSIDEVVNRLNATWGGLIELQLEATDSVKTVINADEVALGVLDDLITEFHTNSVKHGHANSTLVEIFLSQPKVIKVVLSNDGTREPVDSSKGLGFQFLQSVTLKYRFEYADGFKLTLQLPIERKPRA